MIVAPRVRASRESVEYQVHLTDSKQLELRWVEAEGKDDGESAGEGRGDGRSPDMRDDAFEND